MQQSEAAKDRGASSEPLLPPLNHRTQVTVAPTPSYSKTRPPTDGPILILTLTSVTFKFVMRVAEDGEIEVDHSNYYNSYKKKNVLDNVQNFPLVIIYTFSREMG